MFVKILLNYILGFIKIKVHGIYIERFVNLCLSKKIFMWNVKRNKVIEMQANISISDFKRIKQICKKTGVKFEIEKKYGIPFLLHKYRKRKIFLYLLLIVITLLILLSKFIWNIEITGNTKIRNEDILASLEEAGLTVGTYKSSISLNSIIGKIRLERNDIAWIGIDIEGTNAIIKIKESDEAPDIINENEYCNIVSKKTGIIMKITAQKGTAIAKVGDIVREGDILIAGYMEGNYTEARYLHSVGDIQAKVWYSKKGRETFSQNVKKETSNEETKYSIKINNFQINFYKTLSNFQKYDTICKEKKINIFSNFYLPLEILKITNTEYESINIIYTEEELTNKIVTEIDEQLRTEFDVSNIIDKQINVEKYEDGVEVEIIYEVLENIGQQEKILF